MVCVFWRSDPFHPRCQCYMCSIIGNIPLLYFDVCKWYSVSFLMLVICIVSFILFFSFSFARGLSILLNFSKNWLFISLIFLYFSVFSLISFALTVIFFLLLALCLLIYFFLGSWGGRLNYWFETLSVFYCMHFVLWTLLSTPTHFNRLYFHFHSI